jgi:hypothetical protein
MSEVYASSCVKDCRPTICRTSGLTWPSGMYVAMVPRSECSVQKPVAIFHSSGPQPRSPG